MAAPNLKEIEWAIHELKNKESSEGNYILMAALRSCREEFIGRQEEQPQIAAYSRSMGPVAIPEPLALYGDSDFLSAVAGKDPQGAWRIMDELMDTLRAVRPQVYERVMAEMRQL